MIFTRNLLKKRAKLLHSVYSEYIKRNISNPGILVPADTIFNEMEILFISTAVHGINPEISKYKVVKSQNDRIKNGSLEETRKRELLDRALVAHLIATHKLQECEAHISALLAQFKLAVGKWSAEGGVNDREALELKYKNLSVVSDEDIMRGVFYSGSLDLFYKEAIALNKGQLHKGTTWTSISCDPEKIKKSLMDEGVDESKIYIHSIESLCQTGLVPLHSCDDQRIECLVSALASSFSQEVNSHRLFDKLALALCCLIRDKRYMSSQGQEGLLTAGDISLSRFISLAAHNDLPIDRNVKNSCIEAMGLNIGISDESAIPESAKLIWEQHFSGVLSMIRILNRITTLRKKEGALSLLDEIKSGSNHHIFFGDELSFLIAFSIRTTPFYDHQIVDGRYIHAGSAFIEQGALLLEGLCVMPSSPPQLKINQNVFFDRNVWQHQSVREEIVSSLINSLTGVIHTNVGGEPIDKAVNELATEHLLFRFHDDLRNKYDSVLGTAHLPTYNRIVLT